MASWLSSVLFSQQQQPVDELARPSSHGQSPRRPPSRGRASTPSGRAPAPSLSPELSATSGRKRERGWLPHLASSEHVPRASDVALSPTRAEGAFDTPRSYYAQAAAGSTTMRDDDHAGARSSLPAGDPERDDMPPSKKRKGLAGTVLSTALDAAIFTTALGYTAYQLWRDPPSIGNEDVDGVLKARLRSGRNSTGGAEAPPPYAEHAQPAKPRATPPSQIPRRVRHAHPPPRPRISHRKSISPRSDDGSAFEPYALAIPPAEPDHDAFESARFPQGPLPEFHPFRKFSGLPPPGAMDDDDADDDAEMQAIADRMEALIESGRSALMSTPTAWESASGVDEEDERPMPLPVVAPTRKSMSQHQRRQSASAAIQPSSSVAARKKGGSFGRRSLGAVLDSAHLGHQPRSSRGGSLGGLSDVRVLGKEKARFPPVRQEQGKERVLEGVLERSSQYAAKGWWET